MSTPEGESYLDRERFYVALRLIALAQDGKAVSEQSIYDDIAASIPKFSSSVVVKDKWEVDSSDKEKYLKVFSQASFGKGFLSTEEAIEFFKKTQVKPEYLKKIWNLSDPEDSGEFRENQFIVAMHLITRLKNLSEPIPDELPLPLKKIITLKAAEPAKVVSPSEPFADFGLGSIQPSKPNNDPFAGFGINALTLNKPDSGFGGVDNGKIGKTEDFGFGVSSSLNFATLPIKNNLEETRNSVGGIKTSMNSLNSMNSMNKANTLSNFSESTEEKPPEISEFASGKKSVNESPEKNENFKNVTRKSVENRQESRKEEELNEILDKLEKKIQKKFREWKDVRAKMSLERERNQMLSGKLSEANSKHLVDLSQLILNIIED